MLSLFGTGIGRHIAIGRAVVLGNTERTISRHLLTNDQIDDEISRLHFAVNDARAGLIRLADNLPADAPPEPRAFIDVHLFLRALKMRTCAVSKTMSFRLLIAFCYHCNKHLLKRITDWPMI